MWRQNILLKPTDTELLEEVDCTHKLPDWEVEASWFRRGTAFGGWAQATSHQSFFSRSRLSQQRQSSIFPLEHIILVLLQKPSSR